MGDLQRAVDVVAKTVTKKGVNAKAVVEDAELWIVGRDKSTSEPESTSCKLIHFDLDDKILPGERVVVQRSQHECHEGKEGGIEK